MIKHQVRGGTVNALDTYRFMGSQGMETANRWFALSDYGDECTFMLRSTAEWWLAKIADHWEWIERRKQMFPS